MTVPSTAQSRGEDPCLRVWDELLQMLSAKMEPEWREEPVLPEESQEDILETVELHTEI